MIGLVTAHARVNDYLDLPDLEEFALESGLIRDPPPVAATSVLSKDSPPDGLNIRPTGAAAAIDDASGWKARVLRLACKAIADDLSRRTGRETARVTGVERPVPLHFSYAKTAVQETVEELIETRQAPVYIVHFSQAAAMERAQALSSIRVVSREGRD